MCAMPRYELQKLSSNIYHYKLPSAWGPHTALCFQRVHLPKINDTTQARKCTYNFCRTEEFWVHFHMDHPCLLATANLLVILAFPPGKEQEEMKLQLCVHPISSSFINSSFVYFNILLRQHLSILMHVRNVNYATRTLLNFKSIFNLEAPDLSFIQVQHLRNGLGVCALTQWSSPHVWRPSPQIPSRCAPPLLLRQSHLACPAAASSTWPGRDRDRDSKG